MLELMARAGMRISEVLNLTPNDVDERKLILQKPKSGIRGEVVYIPSKLQRRLNDYIRDNDIEADDTTTQRYLGNVSDIEAIRWIENLHG